MNKQKRIYELGDEAEEASCNVLHAESEADVLIVHSAAVKKKIVHFFLQC